MRIRGAIEDLEIGLKLESDIKVTQFLVDLLKQLIREQWNKKDWLEAKSTILKLKQYLPLDDPQQKQLEQKLLQVEKLINTQEKK